MSDFTLSKISKSDSWATPANLLAELDAEFHFSRLPDGALDDPCPIGGSGGLERDWPAVTFLNPPYSKPAPWVRKAYQESLKGRTVIGLLRSDTSTGWYWDWVKGKAEVREIRGRLHFNGTKRAAPFASIIAIWRPKDNEKVV